MRPAIVEEGHRHLLRHLPHDRVGPPAYRRRSRSRSRPCEQKGGGAEESGVHHAIPPPAAAKPARSAGAGCRRSPTGPASPKAGWRRHLHGGHLVLRAVGRPVGVLGGDDVGAGHGMVERRVDDALRHAVGDLRAQRRRADAAGQRHQSPSLDAAHLGVVRDGSRGRPPGARPRSRCAASARRRCTATGCGRSSGSAGIARVLRSVVGTYSRDHEAALAAHEVVRRA